MAYIHNIKVNSWARRRDENFFDTTFKFKNFNDVQNLNKWIGTSKNTVNKQTIVDFSSSYPVNYEDPNFMLISREIMEELISEMFKVYRSLYSIDQNWYNLINPYLMDESQLFLRDPVFAQRVVILNPEKSRIFFIGDIHSSLHSLIEILIHLKKNGAFSSRNSFKLKYNYYIFFLGDLVDRGPYSVEVISLAFLLKIENPENVYIINGNHEDRPMYSRNDSSAGFEQEITYQLGEFEKLHKLMYALPSVIYLEFDGKRYHLSHGAIPLDAYQINDIRGFLEDEKDFFLIEEENPFHPLKWGDLKVENGINLSSSRPEFGSDNITEYNNILGIECLITGHQDLEPLMILPNIEFSFQEVSKNVVRNESQYPIFKFDEEMNELGAEDVIGLSSYRSYSNNFLILKKKIISFDKKNIFLHCSNPDIMCSEFYNQTGELLNYDLFKRYGDIESFSFDPANILALTTSTATISKNIPSNTYLELSRRSLRSRRSFWGL